MRQATAIFERCRADWQPLGGRSKGPSERFNSPQHLASTGLLQTPVCTSTRYLKHQMLSE
jgi:hypothetical protein